MKTKGKNEFSPAHAKRTLKNRGWSYRRAAPELGVTYQHLSEVLNGRRESRSLLQRVSSLPLSNGGQAS